MVQRGLVTAIGGGGSLLHMNDIHVIVELSI